MNLAMFLKAYFDKKRTVYRGYFWCVNDGRDHRHWRVLMTRPVVASNETLQEVCDVTLYIARFLKLRRTQGGFITADYGGGFVSSMADHFKNLCENEGFRVEVTATSV